jgi:hypothetical protein
MNMLHLGISIDVIEILAQLASRECEGRVKSMFPEQRCTYRNPCLVCKSRRAHDKLRLLSDKTKS